MIFTFYKARGMSVGSSLVEEDKLDLATKLEQAAKDKGVQFILPTDVIAADRFDENANTQVVPAGEIPDGWMVTSLFCFLLLPLSSPATLQSCSFQLATLCVCVETMELSLPGISKTAIGASMWCDFECSEWQMKVVLHGNCKSVHVIWPTTLIRLSKLEAKFNKFFQSLNPNPKTQSSRCQLAGSAGFKVAQSAA